MIRRSLRSTTALALSALIAVPGPIAAQETAPDAEAPTDPALLIPGEGGEGAPAEGAADDQAAQDAPAEEAPAEAEAAAEGAAVEEAPAEELTAEEPAAEEPVAGEQIAEEPAPDEVTAEEQAEPEAAEVAEPPAEPSAAEEEVAEPARDPAEADAAVEGAPDAEAAEATDQAPVDAPLDEAAADPTAGGDQPEDAQPEEARAQEAEDPATAAEVEADAVEDVAEAGGPAIPEDPEPISEAGEADDAGPTPDATEEASQTEALIEEAAPEGVADAEEPVVPGTGESADGEAAPAAQAEAPPAPAPGDDAVSEADPAPDAAGAAEEETAVEVSPAPEPAPEPTEAEVEAVEAEAVEAETEAAEDGAMEVPQDDTEAATARANEAAAPAAAAEATAADAAEAETRTITEEEARSSAEAFEEDDDEGLSRFEQSLIAAIGGVAVGALLNNGGRVVENTGDRVVVEREGELQVLKDDDVLLRRPGTEVSTREYADGSTLTVATRDDGTRVTTIRGADGRVLRRTRTLADGAEVVLFDDTAEAQPVDVARIGEFERRSIEDRDLQDLRLALTETRVPDLDRTFTLRQVRELRAVRELVPQVEVAAIEFDTGSARIDPTEAEDLRDIGTAMAELITESPGEVFLVEGHTDAVGSAASNLALSDRRAESVALALTEYFGVPPENMVAQGYGESNLAVRTEGPARENRRATVRRITPLLQGAALQ